ncbi:type II secretion system protein GspM [Caldimonas caldifontis]|uniref:General secretion pathway protein GspM n=1 Tax=Caldimonas caldifontis TaxID=1452508 RepID=A0A2S5SVQ3_9BURK|nr:type II secretion system protein GspM [Caldimonas caldifontis]PPE66657.1 general secretion pathway protein GspM [Caldimonas caldifontis]
MTLQDLRQQWQQKVLTRWNALEARERTLVQFTGAVVALAVLWWVALQPALRTLRETPQQLAEIRTQTQHMQRLAQEARELRGAPPVASAQATRALQASAERLGEGGRLNLQGDRATLTVQGLPGDVLWAWLGEARSAARARPVDVQLTRSGNGYNGTIVLVLSGGAS